MTASSRKVGCDEVTGGKVGDGPDHAWYDLERGWTVGFWVFVAVAGIRLLTAQDLDPSHRAVATACILTVVLSFCVLRPASRNARTGRAEIAYLIVLVATTGVACAADPSLALLLSIAFPQVWLFCPDDRHGVWFTGLLATAAVAGLMTAGGWGWTTALFVVPVMLLSAIFSATFGLWISRIIHQSRERAHLIRQLETTRAELGEAYHLQGVTAERERLAQEIHDTLAQGYTSIIMLAQVARTTMESSDAPVVPRLEDHLLMIEDVARENLGEARSLVAAFAPVALDGVTLVEAVRRLVTRFGTETGVETRFRVSGDLAALTRDLEVVLLRAAQEALANVRRHAGARSVTTHLIGTPTDARVEITDDGKGFSIWDEETPLGFGLNGMRDRARACGGELAVDSTPGRGTRITVRVPLTGRRAEIDVTEVVVAEIIVTEAVGPRPPVAHTGGAGTGRTA